MSQISMTQNLGGIKVTLSVELDQAGSLTAGDSHLPSGLLSSVSEADEHLQDLLANLRNEIPKELHRVHFGFCENFLRIEHDKFQAFHNSKNKENIT